MHHLVDHGSDGLVVCGTTGEASTLNDEEHLRDDRARGRGDARPLHDRRRRRLQRHPPCGVADRARHRARPGRAAVGQPVLQPPEPARDRPPLRGGRPRHRPADPALQHPAAHRRRPAQRPARRAGPARAHRRGQAGQPGQPGQGRRAADLRRQRRHAGRRARSGRARRNPAPRSHLFGEEMHRMVDEPERRREIDAGLQDVYRDLGAWRRWRARSRRR